MDDNPHQRRMRHAIYIGDYMLRARRADCIIQTIFGGDDSYHHRISGRRDE